MRCLTSLELYLNYPAEKVIETKGIEDTTAGMYPCYYARQHGKIKVSTSVTSLIFELGDFELNPSFRPPNWLEKTSFEKVASLKPPNLLKKMPFLEKIRNAVLPFKIAGKRNWYETWETIDKRISKLKPFEKITPQGSAFTFKPDFTLKDKEILIEKTVRYLKKFVNDVEGQFPNYDHIVMTGGKDSQLINLIPKLNEQRWHIFSAEPNFSLVKKWVKENNVPVNEIFTHDNKNEENLKDLKRKIICSDLYSNPEGIKWLPTLKKISEKFGGNCIFWGGGGADDIYSKHDSLCAQSKEEYFKKRFSGVFCWYGNYHQSFKNFVGSPLLSVYYSKGIWENAYRHYTPTIIEKDMDLRDEIGKRLAGREIKWLNENPTPKEYKYSFRIGTYNFYKKYIEKYTPR